ncbi:patatin-like phospholipase family protein [Nitratireductor aquimarinus]|uniref:patatin-like phospholipase family protein n=1 Tax=Nitratireductor aquimarinus TaxID=889300 RepID=UPI001A8EA918|nr:patatin-like phospholipase family protein [Nitratireductor aquimarinus]MBN8242269.1 patatin-like phospholipase family protein [Nitratireductor aquimarinus]MBY6130655.1 patatin-like phospholipase family protein [Nitratireductor aquimarinus]MCA1302588.1 patatin-like phospholipase family protein [Nitratireductor aquimarinus]
METAVTKGRTGGEGSGSGPTFALALGGGGARGLSHLHVIETLDELGIKPTVIAGSSIGALMGAGFAAGMRGKDIHAHARAILSSRTEVASRLWKARPGNFAEMMEGGFRVGQFNAERIIRAFLPPEVPETFEELEIPLKVTATDYFGHSLVVLDQGPLVEALAASAAIPAVFRPIERNKRTLIDGGIYNPVPFDLIDGEADILIAVDVVGSPSDTGGKPPTSIELMFGASQLMMMSIIAMKLEHGRPDILIRPPVSRFRVLDFMKVEAILGETERIRDELKRAVEAAVANFEKARA